MQKWWANADWMKEDKTLFWMTNPTTQIPIPKLLQDQAMLLYKCDMLLDRKFTFKKVERALLNKWGITIRVLLI